MEGLKTMTDRTEQQKRTITVMVCLSSSPSNIRVIQAAEKMLRGGQETAYALYVGNGKESASQRAALQETIDAAKAAGFEIHILSSNDIPLTIAEYARRVHVSDLFIGNSISSPLLSAGRPVSARLAEYLPDVDIHIIPDRRASSIPQIETPDTQLVFVPRDIILVILIMTIATMLSVWFDRSRFSNANIITIYILAVMIASLVTSRRIYGIFAAVLYILLFNFLFIDPRFTLLVYDTGYMMTYFVTIIAALITGSVTIRMKTIARQSAENAYQAKILLDTSNQLEQATGHMETVRITCLQLAKLLNRNILFYEGNASDNPYICSLTGTKQDYSAYRNEKQAIAWTFENCHHAGAFTSNFPECCCRYYCIFSGVEKYGTIGIDMENTRFSEFENSILLSILREFTMALETEQIRAKQRAAEIEAENERLRAGLLRSISHDLRTPLTAIYGNASTLESNEAQLSQEEKKRIYRDMAEDSMWLSTQMENILAMTKLESKAVLSRSMENVYDVICEAMRHVMPHPDHTIELQSENDDLYAEMDAKLIIQVLINLLNNAVKYTPPGSKIVIRQKLEGDDVTVSVEDNGPGIAAEDKPYVFDLYFTGSHSPDDSYRSLGLGLNLCQMILHAHGGQIRVNDNVPHGAVFCFSLKGKAVVYEE
ncbi:MAG: DUF4118 domain-containing protein [Solobacterium sp.]|nr:DUF4118 domain-containing protein [Solobacterium sp.]